jgi:hypothetical protein
MVLVFKLLDEVKDVNSFVEVDRKRIVKGNATPVYFRLMQDKSDSEKDLLRFIPQAGATVTVKFNHIDSEKVLVRSATMPYADDRSIWKVDLLTTDSNIAHDDMHVTLTQGSSVEDVLAISSIVVIDPGQGNQFC